MNQFRKIIFLLFGLAFFFIPLVLWPYTSEVFEFNKTVLLYVSSFLIGGAWAVRMILEKKIIFTKTKIDTALIVFLISQLISTIISIDPGSSWYGYYSRFNGGMFSTLAYALLYWAYVSNITVSESLSLVKIIFSSAFLVSIYAVLEHFGIDKNVWVQDVQSRVFSTLGQPNWLASWIVALMPVSLALAFKEDLKQFSFWVYFSFSTLLFWVLLFTKSRSGFLGFVVSALIFGVLVIWKKSEDIKKIVKPGIFAIGAILVICGISGTQWTPSIGGLLVKKAETQSIPQGPALEVGGTESGTIRKIVWTGALDVWKHYPLFGTGVETFAYSFYQFRPAAHNLVSEWDFVYNKAHNQYLNIAANSGSLGLISYLWLICISVLVIYKKDLFNFGLLAGYVSLLVTNFFGFSVVPTDLLLFLFPAVAVANHSPEKSKTVVQNSLQKILSVCVSVLAFYFVFLAVQYWRADVFYSKAKIYNGNKRADLAIPNAIESINLNPGQALYHSELANSYTQLARAYFQNNDASKAAELAEKAISESQKSADLSPANVNIKRMRFGMFVMLSSINPQYLIPAGQVLVDSIKVAPTDAKFYYNLALFYIQMGSFENAEETFKKTIELKANYKEARLAYSVFLIDLKRNAEAKSQLEYILTNIDPKDEITRQTLDTIK